MTLNPAKYYLRRYHSSDLKPAELKRMLNLWLPFLFNRIRIVHVSEDFTEIDVKLKHTFWNRNPDKAIWGGSIFSAADPFYPIMLKQNALQKGYKTNFYTKETKVKYIKAARTDITFKFRLNDNHINDMFDNLIKDKQYDEWHIVEGMDTHGDLCIHAEIRSFLRIRS